MARKPTAGDPAAAAAEPISLYLLRHADAGDPMAWPGDDDDRPLSPKGRKQARRVARWLASIGLRVDAIVTSPKVRARETAEPVAKRLGVMAQLDDRLGGPLDDAVIRDLIAAAGPKARAVVLVGHDPDFSAIASSLSRAPISLEKGAVARIDLDRGRRKLTGSLRWLVPPRAVPKR